MELILKRMTRAPQAQESANGQHELAQRIAQKLGYPKFVHECHKQKEDTAFLCELIALGHAPFSAASVRRYKRFMVLKANAKMILPWALGAAALIGVVVSSAYYLAHPSSPTDPQCFATLCAVFGLIGLIGTVIRVIYLLTARDYEWNSTPLPYYTRSVPQRALSVAVDIKEHSTRELAFNIEELKQKERPRIVDPFLVVSCGYSRFHVAVWDEPKFEEQIER